MSLLGAIIGVVDYSSSPALLRRDGYEPKSPVRRPSSPPESSARPRAGVVILSRAGAAPSFGEPALPPALTA